ncbi:electron transfer flavoprotein subunit alpha/FixB family protein [Euzebya tangerina]|uniref:electron transfer flavoprotein subunit alpha/FixB family protein n=1 Tax=Euzebya tangerina TaxID=591198 RepID=UPI000E3169E3|nr:electron transfer flavoprotein subunit alpha/FixB family protein [Euzebya tangerina]
MILTFVETDGTGAALTELSRQAVTAARVVAAEHGWPVHALLIESSGVERAPVADDLSRHGAEVIHIAGADVLSEYGPELWGATLADAVRTLEPTAVVAAASDRGSEVMAHAAAIADAPLVANVTEFRDTSGDLWQLTRVRWGGSLLEHAELSARVPMVTTAPHAIGAASTVDDPIEAKVEPLVVHLDDRLVRSRVVDRVVTAEGVTLAEAPVVVGGGRGVGSAEGFAPLEELAELLGGKVGCSRVVTNNGWRPHADQVGQTGTAIAPKIYIACGISGAIQHWAGAKGASHVLAINTDPEANMVSRADYAVIADLHEVVPAIVAAIKARG